MRVHPVLLAIIVGLLCPRTSYAVPPPNLPLPPCEVDDGVETGACPTKSPEVDGSVGGWLSYNSGVGAYVDPQIPACSTWDKNGTGAWSPTPCYREVFPIEVLGCAYIDIRSDRFVESSCSGALFAENQASGQLFKVGKGVGGSCGGAGDFWTYVYGGPATQSDKVWSARGPNSTSCQLDYLGPQPDGLWGPTWVRLEATIDVITGVTTTDSGVRRSSEFYAPIDGDLRDLGPVAAFDVADNSGGEVTFANRSIHTRDEPMTFRWDFGEGATSAAKDPVHQYTEPGTYRVELIAKDATGDEDSTTISVVVDFALVVALEQDPDSPQVGEPFTVTLTVSNPFDSDIDDFRLLVANGLRLEPDLLAQLSGPTPSVPSRIAAGETLTFSFGVEALTPGRSLIESGARGNLGAADVTATTSLTVLVPARLDIALTSTVDKTSKVGDDFDVIATLTNGEEVEIANIKSEPLSLDRSDIVSLVSGPTAADGSDPRVNPITLGPGESTTITWRYHADNEGVVEMEALVSARDPYTDALFYVSADKRVAIETGAIDVSDVRLSPGSPVPGVFGLVRGKVTNIGTLDVKDIDFNLAGQPEVRAVERRISELEDDVSPRIDLLEAGEARDFIIPFGMTTQADGFGSYKVDVTMTGVVELDDGTDEVSHAAQAAGGLDLNTYWSNLLSDYADATLEFFEGVNAWGDSSTIGGSVVGGGEGVLAALQTMGDGLIKTGDLVVNTVSGEYKLTEKGEQLVSVAVEYYHTRSFKQVAQDWADAGVAFGQGGGELGLQGVETVADWMFKVDTAYAKGDSREVAKLIAEPATTVALAIGGEVAVEQVAAKVWSTLIKKGTPRGVVEPHRGPAPLDEPDIPVDVDPADLPFAQRRILDHEDLTDLPTGVPIAESTVLRAGINETEHGWMKRMAKEHGVAFFTRPRPQTAARFAERGFNAKPMAIKIKSVNGIDVKWLGWDDFADAEGLVVMRQPKDPWPKIMEAMESGELQWGSKEVDAIVARYNKRRKEWAEKGALFDKLNAGDGFDIQRNGKTIKTKVTLDDDGVMRFTHNNQPVYSDIDLLQVAYPDGTPIPPELHKQIMEAAGPGFDVQHGDTLSTSDFPDWATAKKFVAEYGAEHMRGGEPLIIVQGDATTLGYVKSVEVPDSVAGSNYDLYGQVRVTYEGAGFP